MAILITGGTGFVGLNLAQQLSAIGEKVVLMAPQAMPIAQQNLLEELLPFFLNFSLMYVF